MPDKVTINTIAYPVVAETRAEAEDKWALINSLYKEVDGLSLLSEALNYDFKKKAHGRSIHATRNWKACPACRRCAIA